MASRSAGWEACVETYLDHVIVLNQRHLRRLMKNYIRYYHEDRTHLGLGKDTPSPTSTLFWTGYCVFYNLDFF